MRDRANQEAYYDGDLPAPDGGWLSCDHKARGAPADDRVPRPMNWPVPAFRFKLTDGNVVHIQGNQPRIQSYLRDVANNQNPGAPVWNWLYPAIRAE